MASVNVYDAGQDKTYKITFNIKSTYLNEDLGTATGLTDIYLDVSTTIKKVDGTSFGHFIVRSLDDVPPDVVSAANNFSDLCQKYISYFMDIGELIASSSSSSTSESSSSTSLSSSSSTSSSSSSSVDSSSSSSSSTSESSESSSSSSSG